MNKGKNRWVIVLQNISITREEIELLLEQLKRALIDAVILPSAGDKLKIDVEGCESKEAFSVRINRSRIKENKYEICGIVEKHNIPLLELHINPTNVHPNPDGSKVKGSHWHVYSEEYGRRVAFPAENIESENFVQHTIQFLDRFNVIETPDIKLNSNQKLF